MVYYKVGDLVALVSVVRYKRPTEQTNKQTRLVNSRTHEMLIHNIMADGIQKPYKNCLPAQ